MSEAYGVLFCSHGNENPLHCTCDRGCYCYMEGNCNKVSERRRSKVRL
jgi:hypothetical protein